MATCQVGDISGDGETALTPARRCPPLGIAERDVAGESEGKRYLNRSPYCSMNLIFTRDNADDDTGWTAPYMCFGQVDYVQHSGEKPRAITWKLHGPMPAAVYATAAAVAQ